MAPRTHSALVVVGARKPLEIHQRVTPTPTGNDVLFHPLFTASTPLDLHRADGGLLIEPPQVLGGASSGIVAEVGPDVTRFKPGDKVFGWAHEGNDQAAHQEYFLAPEWKFAKVPEGFTLEQTVTLPENFITIFNTISTDLGLPVPWPKPADYVPPRADEPILIWGAASSVGQQALQILRYFGYKHLLATASPVHHDYLRGLGATELFDYRDPDISNTLLQAAEKIRGGALPTIPMTIDCIGSQVGSLEAISKVAQEGSTVAIMLPVIIKHASEEQIPEYSMEVSSAANWAKGVNPRGVRTHFVYRNEFFREKLATEIMPTLLAQGVVRPQRFRIIEGATLLERATKALNELRNGISGEKLVWRVSEN
ncbi:chaperonin 10-like protein [Xylariales sp. PMI_506]|nr:chaperonin 10-like protein [Xylariales sp. PMI_506]